MDATAITSGPLKDQPSTTRPLTEAGRAYLNDLVQDMYDQFVTMVAAGRHMDPAAVRKLADGRAYTGRQAKALGLVDEIGGEVEARAWLARTHDVGEALPVQDLQLRSFAARTFGSASLGIRDFLLGDRRHRGLGGMAGSMSASLTRSDRSGIVQPLIIAGRHHRR